MSQMEVCLALGGGGAKGISHIGVIKVLEKEGIKIKAIAGTSIGGIIGSMYAAGLSVAQIEDAVNEVNESPQLFHRDANDGPSLLGIQGLVHVLSKRLGDTTFDKLSMPFACTAVDLKNAQEVVLAKGHVVEAVLATSAVPGILPPRQIDELTLIDGGVLDPVPVNVARWLNPTCPIIAVCLSPQPSRWVELYPSKLNPPVPMAAGIIEYLSKMRLAQAFQIFVRYIDINTLAISELRLQTDKPDVVIRPEVHQYGLLDPVANPQDLVIAGEQAMKKALPELVEALSWQNKMSRVIKYQSPAKRLFSNEQAPMLPVKMESPRYLQ